MEETNPDLPKDDAPPISAGGDDGPPNDKPGVNPENPEAGPDAPVILADAKVPGEEVPPAAVDGGAVDIAPDQNQDQVTDLNPNPDLAIDLNPKPDLANDFIPNPDQAPDLNPDLSQPPKLNDGAVAPDVVPPTPDLAPGDVPGDQGSAGNKDVQPPPKGVLVTSETDDHPVLYVSYSGVTVAISAVDYLSDPTAINVWEPSPWTPPRNGWSEAAAWWSDFKAAR